MIERRIGEALRLGFDKIIVHRQNAENVAKSEIEVVGVDSLDSALEILF